MAVQYAQLVRVAISSCNFFVFLGGMRCNKVHLRVLKRMYQDGLDTNVHRLSIPLVHVLADARLSSAMYDIYRLYIYMYWYCCWLV